MVTRAKKYRILNPQGIPKGVPLLQWQQYTWYEGDTFACPDGLRLDRLLREGYVEEVRGG